MQDAKIKYFFYGDYIMSLTQKNTSKSVKLLLLFVASSFLDVLLDGLWYFMIIYAIIQLADYFQGY